MNPEVQIELQKIVVMESEEKWKKEVFHQICKVLKKMDRSFSLTELETSIDQCSGWRLTFSGIDFKLKTV